MSIVVTLIFKLVANDSHSEYAKAIKTRSYYDLVRISTIKLEGGGLAHISDCFSHQVVNLHLEAPSTSSSSTKNWNTLVVAFVDRVRKSIHTSATVFFDFSKPV